jgi:hypothetical protein
MGFFTWIKELLQPQEGTIRVNGGYQPCSYGGTPNPPPSDPDDLAEMPSHELMERWKRAAIAEYLNDCTPTWRTAALLAFAEGRRQAQSPQLPPPGADPVATDEELIDVWIHRFSFNDQTRAIYDRGRADERTAIFRALGVEP